MPYTVKLHSSHDISFTHLFKYFQITHSDRRPFVCSVCNKTFQRSDRLKAHIRTHTGINYTTIRYNTHRLQFRIREIICLAAYLAICLSALFRPRFRSSCPSHIEGVFSFACFSFFFFIFLNTMFRLCPIIWMGEGSPLPYRP